jgi:hypothetical protein
VFNIAIMTGYAWSSKRVSIPITAHPSIVINIIKQIQASITGEASDLGEYEENAREKKNIQIYKIKHQLPLKRSHTDGKHQFPPQISKSTASPCLCISSQCLPSLHDLSGRGVSSQGVSFSCGRLDFWLYIWHWCYHT